MVRNLIVSTGLPVTVLNYFRTVKRANEHTARMGPLEWIAPRRAQAVRDLAHSSLKCAAEASSCAPHLCAWTSNNCRVIGDDQWDEIAVTACHAGDFPDIEVFHSGTRLGHKPCCSVAGQLHATELVSSLLTVARYLDSLNLIPLLDELREAYDVAKEAGHRDLQSRLMHARRTLAAALDQTLNLHSELAEFQEHLELARGKGNRPSAAGLVLAKASEPDARKIS
jgi:hypothetical protein